MSIRLAQHAALATLVTAALLLSATSASAYAMTMTHNWPDLNQFPSPSDTITVQIHLDTEGNPDGIIAFSMGVEFDPGVWAYDQGASSSSTYMLYVNGKTPYITPLGCCAGGSGPNVWGLAPQQVNIDWGSTALGTGSVAPGAGGGLLATLVFHAVGGPAIGETIFFNYQSNRGNTFAVGTGVVEIIDQVTLSPGIAFTPEPGTALLMSLGLLGLGLARRRAH